MVARTTPWLRLETSSWPKAESSCDEASDEVKAEQKSVSIFNLFTHTSNDVIHGLFEHYSSLSKVIRIFAYCQRFIKNCKKIASQGSSINSSHINTTSLTFSETKTAVETIIRWVQGFYFQEEIRSIKKQISLPPKSPLRSLHPFIDEHGLVRVGGDYKFPASIQFQASYHTSFSAHCGIDYAGPVLIKCNKGRGTKSTKGYIALFVCLATKAVHIEAVGDLTTDSFIAALRRFSARRARSRHIYSDNGTNFVGARRNLTKYGIQRSFLQPPTTEIVGSCYRTSNGALEEVEFNLSPPYNLAKKWQDAQPNLKEDDIVLIKEEGPPGTWPMARVLQVYQATTDWFVLQL
ncbi:transposon polyprotein [Trichonephila clavipes]|nr:transposon polyprotein [Trichonephila clavipes]